MSAVLPRNPFSTRFTRPEAVPFRCPEGDLLVDVRGRVAGGQGSVSSGLVSDNSLDDFSSAGQDVANASGLCRQLVRNLKSVRFGLIVGPHGSGKTTLLYNLVQEARRPGHAQGQVKEIG
jgi:late competence protein required for DNA uptake (superfamily II DNA/RNA helicase)